MNEDEQLENLDALVKPIAADPPSRFGAVRSPAIRVKSPLQGALDNMDALMKLVRHQARRPESDVDEALVQQAQVIADGAAAEAATVPETMDKTLVLVSATGQLRALLEQQAPAVAQMATNAIFSGKARYTPG